MQCNTTSFSEDLRYDYDLTPQSRVLDLGFHQGTFAARIAATHHCWIDAYEPVREWFEAGRALAIPGVSLWHGAVGAWRGNTTVRIHGAMTGSFTEGEAEETPLHLIDSVIGDDGCDLLKLNVEGAEFDILERMCKLKLVRSCRDIQVQFHTCAPDAERRWLWLRKALAATHHLTYDFPWCWENWRRNDAA